MIVPGSANPLMWGNSDPIDELGRIDRSLRLRLSAAPTIRRNAVAGNRQTFVFGLWLKDAIANATEELYTGVVSAGSSEHQLRREPGGQFTFMDGSTSTAYLQTASTWRDPLAWRQVIFAIDTTQPVQANRGFIIVNGSAVPLSVSSLPLNMNTAWHVAANGMGLGCFNSIAGAQCQSLMAQAFVIDGYPTGINQGNWNADSIASLFGVRHSLTRQWRPRPDGSIKAVVDAGGPNSGLWLFKDISSIAALVSDSSVKANNWTASNISLTPGVTNDSSLDTPTTNYATFNPLEFAGNPIHPIYSYGNLRLADAGSASYNTASNATIRVDASKGPWKWECVIGAGVVVSGVTDANYSSCRYNGVGYNNSNGQVYLNTTTVATVATSNAGDVIGFEFDGSNVLIFKNSVLIRTQPWTPSGSVAPSVWMQNQQGGVVDGNFGQRSFATTAFSDTAKVLSAKTLPRPPVPNPKSAFVSVVDTGANILTALAAARAGFGSYIDIAKRRDSGEGWRFMFSDDPGFYMDMGTTATARSAVPAFPGSSYVGYSLRVSAANGIATGRLAHVNGVADTVTDGLGTTRKMLWLKNEASGACYVYHPDLTAGKLLYLDTTAAETTDATIGTVLSSTFVVAAALPSGTYRWIAFGEVDGFLKLFKHIGNAVTDGPFDALGMSPSLLSAKAASVSGADWIVLDAARNPSNVMDRVVRLNLTAAEDITASRFDAVSNGAKVRAPAATEPNQGGVTYVSFAFAAFPFRYANAR